MQIRIWGNTLVLITLFAVGVIVTASQGLALKQDITPTPFTPTPTLTDSLFVNDTCSPPCWFGLTPGMSTVADIRISEIIVFPDSEIDPITGLVANGIYRFGPHGRDNFIEIRDGILWRLRGDPIYRIELVQTLQVLGSPDEIRLYLGPIGNMGLDLIYFDRYLRVYLYTPLQRHNTPPPCSINSISTDFIVDFVHYYSPEAAIEPLERRDDLPPQPTLISYYDYYDGETLYERHVPRNVWNSWLTGRVNMACWRAWEQLSNEMILPDWPPDDSEAEE